ncbi:unnamed protein product [Spirodela intermedia]|nr:unnamed protein product [Spirodela intermedia]
MFSPYKGDPLSWMTGLDLSSNRIDGLIPPEVGQLKGLRSLNLSNNFLRGSIPASLGDMDDLESLDLSHNDLSGEIPRELVRLHFISSFSVAFNNLSGVIPYEKQFSSFSRKSYEGNQGLCGLPLEIDCPADRQETREIGAGKDKSARLEDGMFYSFLAMSVGLGFWGFLGMLLLNRRWRMRYFNAIDGYFDTYVESFRTDGTHS